MSPISRRVEPTCCHTSSCPGVATPKSSCLGAFSIESLSNRSMIKWRRRTAAWSPTSWWLSWRWNCGMPSSTSDSRSKQQQNLNNCGGLYKNRLEKVKKIECGQKTILPSIVESSPPSAISFYPRSIFFWFTLFYSVASRYCMKQINNEI